MRPMLKIAVATMALAARLLTASTPPTADSAAPNSGTGTAQKFAFNYSSAGGFAYLSDVYVLFNSGLNGAGACFVYYDRASNGFYLVNDSGSAVLGPVAPNASTSLQNSQCTLSGTGSLVTGTGNTLTMTLNLTFTGTFLGTQTIFMYAADKGGLASGWQTRGTWTASAVISTPPTADSASPGSGSGASRKFTFNYSSVNGSAYLSDVYALFNGTLNAAGACWIYYDKAASGFFLFNDAANAATGPLAPGANTTLQNGQCTLSGTGSTVTSLGNTLSITLNLAFSSSFPGTQTMYLYAADRGGLNSGWQNRGTWTTIPVSPSPPTADSISPNSGTGTSGVFTMKYSSANGAGFLSDTYLLFNASLNGTGACFLAWDRATAAFYLLNDSGVAFLGPLAPGAAASIQNSQCTVIGTGSSVNASGNTLSMTVNLAFGNSFAGTQGAYLYASDRSGMASGWQSRGTWTIPSVQPPSTAYVTTGQYDLNRTGANLGETILTAANVNAAHFGKLFTWPVSGIVYAQPLYISGLTFPGRAKPLNAAYIATMHNDVYAFDADSPNSAGPLWHVNLGPTIPYPGASCIAPENGVIGTPVIDRSTNTLYVVGATYDGATYFHYLYALDLITGAQKFGSPGLIKPAVFGNGDGNVGGKITFDSTKQLQRPALLLANGNVYAGFGGCGDIDPYHGWLVAMNAGNVKLQTSVFISTPNGKEGGLWQSGRGIVVDPSGFLFLMAGNGTFDSPTNYDYGDAFLKLDASGNVVDWFTPYNWNTLNQYDWDLNSSGPLLIPGSNRIVGGGKQGTVYALNIYAMGRIQNNDAGALQIFQATPGCQAPFNSDSCSEIHGIAYWDRAGSPLLYIWAVKDTLKAFSQTGGLFNAVPAAHNSLSGNFPGGSLTVSANGSLTGTGIVWAITAGLNGGHDARDFSVPATLRAYDASDVSKELWDSDINLADALGVLAKFAPPTVANGKVYAGTSSGYVAVYGLH